MKNDKLVIKGARENNLKNINIEIPIPTILSTKLIP